jgi:hypothetical protein
MIIVKVRSAVDGWFVYHKEIGNTKYLRLNTTDAGATFNLWQNTSPTSSVFSISTDPTVNQTTYTYVAYCWAEVAGYSRFGSYTGNASNDGPFVYCGFRPKYVLIKRFDNADGNGPNWYAFDAARNPYNDGLLANMFINENGSESIGWPIDFVSNGFKIRYNGATNNSAATYIFAAFAESPFKYARAR